MVEFIPEVLMAHMDSLIAAIKALCIFILGWFIAKLVARFFSRFAEDKLSDHQKLIYGRMIFYSVFLLFSVTAIQELGFKISVLLGAAGIFTVALGFASQTSASNLISGMFLLAEKPFQVGDVLRIDGDSGAVISIDLLSVKLRTFENLYIRIPNELLIKSKFVNLTKFPVRRIDIVIGVAYREDIEQVIALLLEVVKEEPRCFDEPAPFCIVSAFGSSSVDLQLSVWGQSIHYRNLKSDLMIAIKKTFDQQGIEIPFPHVSLYAGSNTAPMPFENSKKSS